MLGFYARFEQCTFTYLTLMYQFSFLFTIACKAPLSVHSDGTMSSYDFPFQSVANSTRRIAFSVRANKDIYLALSPQPYQMDDMYEIVLGRNTGARAAFIRRCRGCRKSATVGLSRSRFLSSEQFMDYWMSWEAGRVAVGYGGSEDAFLEWQDESPLAVRYVGFQSGRKVPATLQFCGLGKAWSLHFTTRWPLILLLKNSMFFSS